MSVEPAETAGLGSLAGLLADDEGTQGGPAASLASRGRGPTEGSRSAFGQSFGGQPSSSRPGRPFTSHETGARGKRSALSDVTNTPGRARKKAKAEAALLESAAAAPAPVQQVPLQLAEPEPPRPRPELPEPAMSWADFMADSGIEFRRIDFETRRRLTELPVYLDLPENPVARRAVQLQHDARERVHEAWLADMEDVTREALQSLRKAEAEFPQTGRALVAKLRAAREAGTMDAFREELLAAKAHAADQAKAGWAVHRARLDRAEADELKKLTPVLVRMKADLERDVAAAKRRAAEQRTVRDRADAAARVAALTTEVQQTEEECMRMRKRRDELEAFVKLHPLSLQRKEPLLRLNLSPAKQVCLEGGRVGMTRMTRHRLPAWEKLIRLDRPRDGEFKYAPERLWASACAATRLEVLVVTCERLATAFEDVRVLELHGDGSKLRLEITCPDARPPHAIAHAIIYVPDAVNYPALRWDAADISTLKTPEALYAAALRAAAEGAAPFDRLAAAVERCVAALRDDRGWTRV